MADDEKGAEKWELPPLGVMPRWLWLERRAVALSDAIRRSEEAGLHDRAVPWAKELLDILCDLAEEKPG